jgi:glycosyltransferase involved in cell wall biosynthesis
MLLSSLNLLWRFVNHLKIKTYFHQQSKNSDLKILLLTPYPPYPPYTGAAIRRFQKIKYLGERHHLVLVSFMVSYRDYELLQNLECYCKLILGVKIRSRLFPIFSHQPQPIKRFNSLTMKRLLHKLKKIDFDVVIFDSIFMAQYQYLFPNAYQILAEHNIESTLIEQIIEAKSLEPTNDRQLKLLMEYENEYWAKFPLKTVVSDRDLQQLDNRCQIGKTIVVKNGIDTQKILPVHHPNTTKILLMGLMSYSPNIDAANYFVREILPIVWQQEPTLSFCIAGREPTKQVYDLAIDPRIEIVANPEDMSEIARQCAMTVVPLRLGSGTRIKILHSMAMGLPTVSTSLGCEGLDVVDGLHLLIRDNPAEFARGILQVYRDAQLSDRLRVNGRQLVEREYDWHQIFEQFEAEMRENLPLFRELIDASPNVQDKDHSK